jgi:hypothetical protein
MGRDQDNGDWRGVEYSSIENDIITGRNFMIKLDDHVVAKKSRIAMPEQSVLRKAMAPFHLSVCLAPPLGSPMTAIRWSWLIHDVVDEQSRHFACSSGISFKSSNLDPSTVVVDVSIAIFSSILLPLPLFCGSHSMEGAESFDWSRFNVR